MDNFTISMLERAEDQLPSLSEVENGEWWETRGLDENTVFTFARTREINPRLCAAVVMGIMVGFELGKLASDPTFELARELNQ